MIGGLYLDSYNSTESTVSIPYFQDDFTWCVQSAKFRPWILSPMTAMTPAVWLLVIFGYGYVFSFVLFLLIQFDKKYKKRNNINWHYALWLIILPSVTGMGKPFQPLAWKVRLIYGLILTMLVILSQTMVGHLLKFTQIRFLMHQTATVQEVADAEYQLMGSKQVGSLIKIDDRVRNPKYDSFPQKSTNFHKKSETSFVSFIFCHFPHIQYTESQRQSFFVCPDMHCCLDDAVESSAIAIGASRHHIYATSAYQSNGIYCFDRKETIADYRISMLINADFNQRHNIDGIIRHILEAGLFTGWNSVQKRPKISPLVEFGSQRVTNEQISAAWVFMIACGWFLAISTFFAERIISRKRGQENASRIWVYLERFFDGKRHYFKNLPERLEQSRKLRQRRRRYRCSASMRTRVEQK